MRPKNVEHVRGPYAAARVLADPTMGAGLLLLVGQLMDQLGVTEAVLNPDRALSGMPLQVENDAPHRFAVYRVVETEGETVQ